jgi:hypothetical protein
MSRGFTPTTPDDLLDPPRFAQVIETTKDVLIHELRQYFANSAQTGARRLELPTIEKYATFGDGNDPFATAVSIVRRMPDRPETLPHIAVTSSTGTERKVSIGPPYVATVVDTPVLVGTLAAPFALTPRDKLVLEFQHQRHTWAETVYFTDSRFPTAAPIGEATAIDVARVINGQLQSARAQVRTSGTDTYVDIVATGDVRRAAVPFTCEVHPDSRGADITLGLARRGAVENILTSPLPTLVAAPGSWTTADVGRWLHVRGSNTPYFNDGRFLVLAVNEDGSEATLNHRHVREELSTDAEWFIGAQVSSLTRTPKLRFVQGMNLAVQIDVYTEDENTRGELVDLVTSFFSFFLEQRHYTFAGRADFGSTTAPTEFYQIVIQPPVRASAEAEVPRTVDGVGKLYVNSFTVEVTTTMYVDREAYFGETDVVRTMTPSAWQSDFSLLPDDEALQVTLEEPPGLLPELANLEPAPGDVNVFVGAPVSFTIRGNGFDLFLESINVTVGGHPAIVAGELQEGWGTGGGSSIVVVGDTAEITLQPFADFDYDAVITIEVQAISTQGSLDTSYTFTVQSQVAPPVLVALSPGAGTMDVSRIAEVSFRIEGGPYPVQLASVNATVDGVSAVVAGVVQPAFNDVNATVTIVDNDISVNLDSIDPLAPLTAIVVAVQASSLGGELNGSYSFTTSESAFAPFVLPISPVNGETDVFTTASISFRVAGGLFAVDPLSVGATVDSNSAVVAGVIQAAYNGAGASLIVDGDDVVVTLVPTSSLPLDTLIVVGVTASSVGGDLDTSYSFTTVIGLAPSLLATAPLAGAFNIDVTSTIAYTIEGNGAPITLSSVACQVGGVNAVVAGSIVAPFNGVGSSIAQVGNNVEVTLAYADGQEHQYRDVVLVQVQATSAGGTMSDDYTFTVRDVAEMWSFDGVDERLVSASGAFTSTMHGATGATWMFWYRKRSTNAASRVGMHIGQDYNAAGVDVLHRCASNDATRGRIFRVGADANGSRSVRSAGFDATAQAWSCWAVRYNGTTGVLEDFCNGVLISNDVEPLSTTVIESGTFPATLPATRGASVGAAVHGAEWFLGEMGHVSMWNTALSDEEVIALCGDGRITNPNARPGGAPRPTHHWALDHRDGFGAGEVLDRGTAGTAHLSASNMDASNRAAVTPPAWRNVIDYRSWDWQWTSEGVDAVTDGEWMPRQGSIGPVVRENANVWTKDVATPYMRSLQARRGLPANLVDKAVVKTGATGTGRYTLSGVYKPQSWHMRLISYQPTSMTGTSSGDMISLEGDDTTNRYRLQHESNSGYRMYVRSDGFTSNAVVNDAVPRYHVIDYYFLRNVDDTGVRYAWMSGVKLHADALAITTPPNWGTTTYLRLSTPLGADLSGSGARVLAWSFRAIDETTIDMDAEWEEHLRDCYSLGVV